jgi:hypothetical protein
MIVAFLEVGIIAFVSPGIAFMRTIMLKSTFSPFYKKMVQFLLG